VSRLRLKALFSILPLRAAQGPVRGTRTLGATCMSSLALGGAPGGDLHVLAGARRRTWGRLACPRWRSAAHQGAGRRPSAPSRLACPRWRPSFDCLFAVRRAKRSACSPSPHAGGEDRRGPAVPHGLDPQCPGPRPIGGAGRRLFLRRSESAQPTRTGRPPIWARESSLIRHFDGGRQIACPAAGPELGPA